MVAAAECSFSLSVSLIFQKNATQRLRSEKEKGMRCHLTFISSSRGAIVIWGYFSYLIAARGLN